MTTKLMASVAFGGASGEPNFTDEANLEAVLDPDLAADELRQAGYEVSLLPDKYGGRLAHPLDDFIEAAILGKNVPKVTTAIMDEIDAIVGQYGGLCIECGPIPEDYVPFANLVDRG
jgi:hypothetical protein